MRMGTTFVLGAALCVGTVFVSRDAHAIGPVDIEVGARIGGGTSPFSHEPSPLGFGIGARGGASIFGFYGGLSFMYYAGASGTINAQQTPTMVSTSEHAFLYGVDVGYGTKLVDLITLRGQLGVGNFSVNYTGFRDATLNNLYLEPCLTGLVGLGIFFIGADVSLIVLPGVHDPAGSGSGSSWDTAFTAHGQLGVTF